MPNYVFKFHVRVIMLNILGFPRNVDPRGDARSRLYHPGGSLDPPPFENGQHFRLARPEAFNLFVSLNPEKVTDLSFLNKIKKKPTLRKHGGCRPKNDAGNFLLIFPP